MTKPQLVSTPAHFEYYDHLSEDMMGKKKSTRASPAAAGRKHVLQTQPASPLPKTATGAPVKAEGGMTFVQDEATAKYYGMPRSAIAAGYLDVVLPSKQIPKKLARIGGHPYVNRVKPEKNR